MNSEATICAIMTVYNPEKITLTKILDRLKRINISHVLIINNGRLKLSFESDPYITVYSSSRNLGTAGGYKLGISKACEAGYDYIWLLDDDNLPEGDALTVLLSEHKRLGLNHAKNRLMLLSSRPYLFKTVFLHKNKEVFSIGPKEDSYLGFHYSQLFEMFKSRLLGIKPSLWSILKKNHSIVLDTAYYGGLFFHKSVVADGTKLHSELFIYWDDLNFTNHFVTEGGSIFLIPKSVINDIGHQNDLNAKKPFLHHPFIDLEPRFKAFYYIRNLSYYENKRSTSTSFVYQVNKVIMMFFLCIMSFLRNKPERLSLLIKSIKCGRRLDFSKTSNRSDLPN